MCVCVSVCFFVCQNWILTFLFVLFLFLPSSVHLCSYLSTKASKLIFIMRDYIFFDRFFVYGLTFAFAFLT